MSVLDKVTQWFRKPSGGLVDRVGWLLLISSTAVVLGVPVQLYALSFHGLARERLPLVIVNAITCIPLMPIGVGLMRRRRWARPAFLALISISGAVQSYWALALNLRWPMPQVVRESLGERLALLYLVLMVPGSGVIVWLAYRFTRPEVVAEFTGGDR